MTTAVALPRPFPTFVLADAIPGRRARDIALVVGAALLTAVLAQVSIPVAGSPVPITGQTLAVVLTAAALGPARGVSAQLLYILLGAIGLPFYSEAGSGWTVVAGPTGGYLVGFVPAALLIGMAARRGRDRHLVSAALLFILGQGVIFAVGVPWLAAVADLSPSAALTAGFYPFIVGGLIKASLGSVVMAGAWRLVGSERGDLRV